MTTIRSTHDDDHPHFAIVRPTAQNKALSYDALGMLAYLLSQADDWVIGVDDLIREGCGRDKAYRILKELSEAGHLTRVRSAAGQHKPPVWANRVVYEQPFTEMPDLVKPYHEAPNPEKAELVKASVFDARAQQQDSKALTTEHKDQEIQELKDKDKNAAAATAGAREGLSTQPVQSAVAVTPSPVPPPPPGSDEPSPEPPRIYAVYVENIRQQITPIIADKLKDYVKDVGEQWVEDAIVEAVTHNAKTWAYIQSVLDRWIKDGRDMPRPSTVKGAGFKSAPQKPVEVTPKGGVGLSWQQYQEVTSAKAK